VTATTSPAQVARDTGEQATTLPSTALVKRWGELFANILEQFRADGRSPVGILQGDFSTREIAILTNPEDEKSAVRSTVSRVDLESGDLKAMAQRIYARWKARAR
jgi:hypothetical protein